MPTKKKKHPKMDKLLVSKEKFEISFIHKRYKVPVKEIKEARKEVGRSRGRVYAWLRERGYDIPKRK